MHCAIIECLIEQRPFTFIGTLDAAGLRFNYSVRLFMNSILTNLKGDFM
jgi:hypothetical protein